MKDSISTSSSKLVNRLRDTSSQAKLSTNSKLKLNYDDGLSQYSNTMSNDIRPDSK